MTCAQETKVCQQARVILTSGLFFYRASGITAQGAKKVSPSRKGSGSGKGSPAKVKYLRRIVFLGKEKIGQGEKIGCCVVYECAEIV